MSNFVQALIIAFVIGVTSGIISGCIVALTIMEKNQSYIEKEHELRMAAIEEGKLRIL